MKEAATTVNSRWSEKRSTAVSGFTKQADQVLSADTKHFLERHTFEFFDFLKPRNIRDSQGMWPRGTTPNDVVPFLDEALTILDGPPRIDVTPNNPYDLSATAFQWM
jgi:hypothetical protein